MDGAVERAAERRLSEKGAAMLAAAFGGADADDAPLPSSSPHRADADAEVGGMGPSLGGDDAGWDGRRGSITDVGEEWGGISIFNPRGSITSDDGGAGAGDGGGGGDRGGWDSRRGSLVSDDGGAEGARGAPTVLLEGWLLMRGALVKNWKRRWVALCRGCHYEGLGLSWFDLGNEHGTRGSADGIVEVTGRGAAEAGGRPFAFSVRCRGIVGGANSWRELYMCAESDEELASWLSAIRGNIIIKD